MVATPAPKLTALLETDNNGQPRFRNAGGHKHYSVVFEVENMPENVYAGTFELDPTYYDPVRTLRPDNGKLQLKTTSYGDYELKVSLKTKDGEIVVVDSLVRALERARGKMPNNPAVDQAIAEIAHY